jgi:hypothetical protein
MPGCALCITVDTTLFICRKCHQKLLQEALDKVTSLQRDLLNLRTSYSFAKYALTLHIEAEAKK